MTDPKELFLLFNISSALLPELGSPAELDWSLSLSCSSFPFPTFMSSLSSFPSYALFSPSIPFHVTLVL